MALTLMGKSLQNENISSSVQIRQFEHYQTSHTGRACVQMRSTYKLAKKNRWYHLKETFELITSHSTYFFITVVK